jgi:5'-deoxynucleotidase YfbR-like HD superfamily hydrolase
LSAEGRFFKQTDRIENFLQAMEYWEKSRKMPRGSWWIQAREIFDDSVILEFMGTIDKKFSGRKK